MLNVFRENLKSLKWLLWIVAISMTLYLGSFFFGDSSAGPAGAWAASVDGDKIPELELRSAVQNLDRSYRDAYGEVYAQVRPSLRIGTIALGGLIQRRLILEDARELGIVASDDDLARAIRESPTFQDAEGNFVGAERYQNVFAGRPGGVAAFEDGVREDIVIRRWDQMILESIAVGESELEDLYRQRNEKTAIKYGIVLATDQEVDVDVTDAQVSEWYAAHGNDYKRGEARKIRYIVIKRQDLVDTVTVTPEQVLEYYEANKASYEQPAQRNARHILIRVAPDADEATKSAARAKAEDLLARAQAGEDFAAMATASSDDQSSGQRGGDLGWFGRGAMVPPFDAAVFNAGEGEFAPLTETQFGFHVIQVLGAREAGVTPLEEVSAAIERNLQMNEAQELVSARADRLAGRLKSAAELDALAAGEGLTVETLQVTENDALAGLGASPDFLPAVFDAEAGTTTAPLRVLEGLAIVAVDEIVEPGVAPLTEVVEQVKSDLLEDRKQQAALTAAQAAIDRGGDLEATLKRLELEVQESGDLTPRSTVPSAGGPSAELREQLFADYAQIGDRGVTVVPAGALVWQITSRQGFDFELFEAEKANLRNEVLARRQNQVREAVLTRLRDEHKVEINEALVSRFDQPNG